MLNVRSDHTLVGSCGVKITIKARQRGQFLMRKLFTEKDKIVSSCSETMIPLLSVPLLHNRDFLFHPTAQLNLTLIALIMYHDTKNVLIRNIFDQPLQISRCQRLDHIIDIRYNKCFLAEAKTILNSATVSP